MKQNYCDISVILDRSGSMQSIKKDVIGGYNKFLDSQKKVPGECNISLYQFDDQYEVVYEDKDIKNAPDLTTETFIPRGWTALLDAIGRTINSVGSKLEKIKENDRPSKVLIIIQSDGEENRSKEFTRNKIAEMIKHQKDNYNWDFVFLGANQDAILTAEDYGISMDSALTFAASSIGTNTVYDSLSVYTSNLRSGRKASFSQSDRDLQEKELSKV